jgi:two-component system KDP operon response regulator KdpE
MSAAPPCVLVVDDEPPIRKLLRMGLSVHGYQVIEATNGKNALELLGKSPDIIILDLGLPDGPRLCVSPRGQQSVYNAFLLD